MGTEIRRIWVTERIVCKALAAAYGQSCLRNQKEKHPIGCFFFLERCVPCGNVMRTTCVMCHSDVMCASRVNWNTSHHCEQSEQHHYTARCSITCPTGQTSLCKADVFAFTYALRLIIPEVVVVGVPPQRPTMRTDLDIGAENLEAKTVSKFFLCIF